MKKLLIIIPIVFGLLLLTWCTTNDTSDQKLWQQQETLMLQATDQVWMPAIKNFQERKLAKEIMELRDQENLITYSYLFALDWKLVFLCKSMGYGLPYSVQYTSPQKRYTNGSFAYDFTVPQADPNWLYMPEWLSATWIMCIDPNTNKPRPVYVESDVTVSPFLLSVK